MSTVSSTQAPARRAARRAGIGAVARAGLAGHGVVYLLLGVLALLLAFGKSSGEADQRGALQQLAGDTGGRVLLLVVAIGLSAYALWHAIQVLLGPFGQRDSAGERVQSAVRAIIYGALAGSAFAIVADGRTTSQSKSQQAWTARVMAHTGGRWLVAVVGVIVIVVGAALLYRAAARKFESDLDLGAARPGVRTAVVRLGQLGGVARGVVVGLAGVLLVVSAVQYDPHKARGVDGALRALRDTAGGPWLLAAAALGLIMFGLYGLAEARYRRV